MTGDVSGSASFAPRAKKIWSGWSRSTAARIRAARATSTRSAISRTDSLGGLEARRVVEKDGYLVGFGALYALEVWIGGRKVPVGGIASIAVAPEARRQGVARALLSAMDAEMESSGAALSLLYPFEEGFYARLGYAVTSPLLALRVSSRKLLSMQALGNPSLTAVAADGTQAMALYEDVARRTSGRIVRSEIRWLDRFSRENRYWMGVAREQGAARRIRVVLVPNARR